jgi:hypothetical protein
MSYLTIPISGMLTHIHLTMFPAPHPLIRRTVQRNATAARRKLTLLSLPNDTLVDLILVHLCVRDILRLRSVRIRHLGCLISLILISGMQTILRANTPTNGLEAHLAHLSPSTSTSPSHHPLLLPLSQQLRGRTSGHSCPRRGSKLAEYHAQIL